jgi:hypothetical protein
MRTPSEVQRAHDILHAFVTQEVNILVSPAEHLMQHAVHDTLSWVLEGECGNIFEENLERLVALAERLGYKLVPK